MNKNRSSIHSENGIDGFGEIKYIEGTQAEIHYPVSQENVQLTPEFKQCTLKLISTMPIMINPFSMSPYIFRMLNTTCNLNQVYVVENEKTGDYLIKFDVAKEGTLTDGAQLAVYEQFEEQIPSIMGVPGQWVQQTEGRWKYYDQGQAVSNAWVQYKGDNYFIEADQYMVTGWKTLDKNTYYFKTEAEDTNKDGSYGYRVSDWWMIDEKWYYFDSDGAMVTSKVIHCKGKEYYVGSDGVMVVNKTIVDPESNQTYKANENGVLIIDKPLKGSYVDIPQNRDLGTVISYMGWHKITSKSSVQYKLKRDATDTGRTSIASPEYYAMIDDRILIATKENIGGILKVSVGDYVDVDFKKKDGTIKTYDCIIGDVKGVDASSNWGHYDGKGVVEIIYYDYNPPAGYNKCTNNPWGQGRVIRITKVGGYFDLH